MKTRREMFRILGGSVVAAPAIATGAPVPKEFVPVDIPAPLSQGDTMLILPGHINDLARALAEVQERLKPPVYEDIFGK